MAGKWWTGIVLTGSVAIAVTTGVWADTPATVPTTTTAAGKAVSPADGVSAYVYHLDGNLDNAGSAGPAGNLKDPGFISYVDSPLGAAFGKAGFDAPKMGHNHVKVPLASLTDDRGSFTVEAIFQFPADGVNSDPDRAKFTIAGYGGEEDGPPGTTGGGFYLNYNADADAAGQAGHVAGTSGRLQFVVNNRARDKANVFSRKVMINALVPVTAVPGHVYRAVAAWDNPTGVARIGWSEVPANVTPETVPPATQVGSPNGDTGLVIDGTPFYLTVGTAESEDGGNGFATKNVKIDDVRFVAGVDKEAFTTAIISTTTAPGPK